MSTQAARFEGMLDPGELSGGLAQFLSARTFAAITARDTDGRLWTTALTGAPGFLAAATSTTLTIDDSPALGDPLHRLAPGQPVGLLVIDFATRRRVRINGTLTSATDSRLSIDVEQAYGNCPQYIQHREVGTENDGTVNTGSSSDIRRGQSAAAADLDLIRTADTFLVGSTHPIRGTDTSHRGGPPGFVRVEGPRNLWWPDYPGNNMFNTLGNFEVDPEAALLFIDFDTGRYLHVSGSVQTEWSAKPAMPGDDGHTGRRTVVTIEQVVSRATALRSGSVDPYPRNPPVTD
ncbi:pyridoxamine 5'-phosphate oxidase family protein [Williamsia soli]|uniref:pyridoxamine 5'-phosphate oxidase family protein n=1 Tax=Williamsia soli TaxID=364929 RepID=UPI0027DB7977|nr:pyridoxamine 5'-phosphate oxidase family protein [Williamsia soli]